MKKKLFSIVCSIGLVSTMASTSYADVLEIQDMQVVQDLNQQQIQISYDEKENSELQDDFERIFVEEMNEIEKITQVNKNLRKNLGKDHATYVRESSEMTPLIDSEKMEGDNYYRLVAYTNGTYYKLALKDGSYSSGTGYNRWVNRKAYGELGSPAINALSGHVFQSIISYTHDHYGYDKIQSASPYSFINCQNAYTAERSFNETSARSAYVTFYYDGRVGMIPGVGPQYSPFRFTIYVGRDSIRLIADLR